MSPIFIANFFSEIVWKDLSKLIEVISSKIMYDAEKYPFAYFWYFYHTFNSYVHFMEIEIYS